MHRQYPIAWPASSSLTIRPTAYKVLSQRPRQPRPDNGIQIQTTNYPPDTTNPALTLRVIPTKDKAKGGRVEKGKCKWEKDEEGTG